VSGRIGRVDRLVRAETVDNAPLIQIVGRHLHPDFVSRKDVYPVDPHAARQVTEELVILRLGTQNPDAERGIREGFFHDADELNDIFRHKDKI